MLDVSTLLAAGCVAFALALLWRKIAACQEPPGPFAVPLLGTLAIGVSRIIMPRDSEILVYNASSQTILSLDEYGEYS